MYFLKSNDNKFIIIKHIKKKFICLQIKHIRFFHLLFCLYLVYIFEPFFFEIFDIFTYLDKQHFKDLLFKKIKHIGQNTKNDKLETFINSLKLNDIFKNSTKEKLICEKIYEEKIYEEKILEEKIHENPSVLDNNL